MNNANEASGKPVREGLVFFTINDGNGASNPRSRAVILAIKERHVSAFVYKSLEEAMLLEPVAGMVPIYDTDCVGGPYFEREKEDISNPSWATELSTGSCVAVCQACVSRQHIIETTAKDLIRRFDPYNDAGRKQSHRGREDHFHRPIPVLTRTQRVTRVQAHFMPAREKKRRVSQF